MGQFKAIDLNKAPDDKDVTSDVIYNLAPLVPWRGVPGDPVQDPFEGSSKMPGLVRVPFDAEDYEQRAASLEREAAKQYFGVTDFTSLREPTTDERATTQLNGIVLMNLETAAWCRAYAAQLRGTAIKAERDTAANERAKARRLAQRKLTEVEAEIKTKERWLKLSAKDLDEAKRMKELLEIANTAQRYEAELPSLRLNLDYFKREVERFS